MKTYYFFGRKAPDDDGGYHVRVSLSNLARVGENSLGIENAHSKPLAWASFLAGHGFPVPANVEAPDPRQASFVNAS